MKALGGSNWCKRCEVFIYIGCAVSRTLNAPTDTSARDLAGTGRFSGAKRNCWAYVNTSTSLIS